MNEEITITKKDAEVIKKNIEELKKSDEKTCANICPRCGIPLSHCYTCGYPLKRSDEKLVRTRKEVTK